MTGTELYAPLGSTYLPQRSREVVGGWFDGERDHRIPPLLYVLEKKGEGREYLRKC
jgi:hypothetical protein